MVRPLSRTSVRWTPLALFCLVACSRGDQLSGESSKVRSGDSNQGQETRPGTEPPQDEQVTSAPEGEPPHEDTPQEPFPREEASDNRKPQHTAQISTDRALEPFAISASVEGETGEYYYFDDRSAASTMRLACRSARRAPVVPPPPRGVPAPPPQEGLTMPCVLVTKGAGGDSWVHQVFDANLYDWKFMVERCPKASLKGSHLFPENPSSRLLTPATMVSLPVETLDYCLHARTVLSLVVVHKSSQEKHIFEADLKVEMRDLATIYRQSTVTQEKDSVEGLTFIESTPFFPYLGAEMQPSNPYRFERQFTFKSSQPGDPSAISCTDTLRYGTSTLDPEGPLRISCEPPDFPHYTMTRWKILVTNCPAIRIAANAARPRVGVNSSSPYPYASLTVLPEELDACMRERPIELIFFIERSHPWQSLFYSGVLREI